MGGRPKGLLPAPDTGEPLVARLLRLGREAGLETVLVGDASAYASVAPGVPALADEPGGLGPLGGLNALLRHAGDRPALALACDLPRASRALLERLRDHPGAAEVLAARRGPDAPWEPFLARYRSPMVRAVLEPELARTEGLRSFQALLSRLTIEELVLRPEEWSQLDDWDSPEDLLR
jgi:molybdopterin-guanine dinucleotide biosynthesis protein A